jgi:hypothetical protein
MDIKMDIKMDGDNHTLDTEEIVEDCAICGLTLNEKYSHKLICGHTFHYECLLKSFNCSDKHRFCPYCRKKCEHLPLINGLKKVLPGIHCKSINQIHIYNISLKENYNKKCNHVLQRGKNKGQECEKNCKLGYYVCNAHFKPSNI